MKATDLQILVCYYKEILLKPKSPEYLCLQCGTDSTGVDLGIVNDNTGDNISSRNKYWSEITGLYWAWKNLPTKNYMGLCSYRRFFNFKKDPVAPIHILPLTATEEIEKIQIPEMDEIFSEYDIIVPQPYTYAYNFDKICRMNYRMEDFDTLKKIISEISPEYLEAYDYVFYKTNRLLGHNMFIMKNYDYVEYCSWVFSILLEAEKRINPTNYPIAQVRVFGYMHEILLGVFIEKKKMKPYYSQLTWLAKSSEGFKFNKRWYRVICQLYYHTIFKISN